MQLRQPCPRPAPQPERAKVAASLVAATCSLLGAAPGPSLAAEIPKTWQVDTSVSYYGESSRVTDASVNALASRLFRFGRSLVLRLTVDSLTGASASGAVPSRLAQTFTTPSGNSVYRVSAGTTPLDPTFLDTRIAAAATWEQPLGARNLFSGGITVSNEYDYLHLGVNGRISRDFNERNTRVSVGLAFASDTVDPVGGAPLGLSAMLPQGDSTNKLADDSKTVADLLLGVSQVLGRRTIAQFNYGLSRSSGYLTDPYKLLTVVDPIAGDPVPGPGGLFLYRYERRPDERTKHTFFGQIKHRLGRSILDASYRLMSDDWGVRSHTLDLRWRHPLGQRWYLEPHARYYTQEAADFYRSSLLDGDPLPNHASADYRLGDLDGTTLGLKLGHPLDHGREWAARIEYYEQSGRAPPGSAFGSLGQFDLFPTVDAVIVQVGYRF